MSTLTFVIVISGALLMRVGLAMYSVGLVRSKNAVSTMGRHLLDLAISILAFWIIGGAIATQQQNPYMGFNTFWLFGPQELDRLAGGLPVVIIAGAVLVGATAERATLWSVLILSLVSSGIILPIALNWVSMGWLNRLGISFGSEQAVIHVGGAAVAWVAVRMVGPRDGKYHRDGSSSLIPGHNFSGAMAGALLAAVGAMLLIAPGRAVNELSIWPVYVVVNVLLGVSASVVISAAYCQWRFGKLDLSVVTASLLGGVVAIACSGAMLPGYGAVFTGAVTGVLVPFFLVRFDMVWRMDDVTGAITIHGIAGAWGLLAGPIFDRFYDVLRFDWPFRSKQIMVHAAALVAIFALSYCLAWLAMKLLSRGLRLRVKDADEFDGLDLAEHDVAAYPDFQQNTIKSYHLREA